MIAHPSKADFPAFGLDDLAYIKMIDVDGHRMAAVHAADGTPLTVLSQREIAFATVRQYGLLPLSVH